LAFLHAWVYIADVTLLEAAEVLGLAPATLRHQIRNGRLRAAKVGRDWVVSEEELKRYQALSRGRPGRRPRQQLNLGLFEPAPRQES
jgi:excisionase family DNA binding protein